MLSTGPLPMFEPKENSISIQYQPSDSLPADENPPVFVWLPENDYFNGYQLEVSSDNKFKDKNKLSFDTVPFNSFRPDCVFKEGEYFWRYRRTGIKGWSSVRSFNITNELPVTVVPIIEKAVAQSATAHPRLMIGDAAKIADLNLWANSEKGQTFWDVFLKKSVGNFVGKAPHGEPQPYPNNQRDVPLWRRYYIEGQEALYTIRHLSIAGKVTENKDYLAQAKDWLLDMATWDVDGPSSRHYNDEVAFRVILSLAWGFDWLYDQLDESELALVQAALTARGRELYKHQTQNAKIHIFPYDSHAIRAISAALIPAAIALQHHEPEAKEWLNFSINYLYTLYAPWSGVDGGWAEGPHYWTTAMAYLLDAMQMAKAYLGTDVYQRPIIKNTGDFPMYTKSPGSRRGYFGDDSTLGDLPSLKTAYSVLHLAGATGRSEYTWFFEEHNKHNISTGDEFYNYGWWDFNFDRLLLEWYFDVPEPAVKKDFPRLNWFKSIGWACIQSKLDEPENHIQFILKSSRFGSISHSAADQGAFVIYAFGHDLAIHSGYYVAYNSSMHLDWRKQTRSKNAMLINGEGQYAGKDKVKAKQACGDITLAVDNGHECIIQSDATQAYQSLNDKVKKVTRDVHFVDNSYFIIIDEIELTKPQTCSFVSQSESPFIASTKSMSTGTDAVRIDYSIIYSTSDIESIDCNEAFEGVNPKDFEGLAKNYVGTVNFKASIHHRIVTMAYPYKTNERKSYYTFMDDQGFTQNVYITNENDESYSITLEK